LSWLGFGFEDMVVGDYLGYSSYGSSAYPQKPAVQTRPAVTLEAERDPYTPHQYRVATAPLVIPPAEAATDIKSSDNKARQNNDPVSRAFLAIANYSPARHSIDIRV
jgi:hypothetical protein